MLGWAVGSSISTKKLLNVSVAANEAPQSHKTKRPAWAMMWLVGLAVATAQGITQAIASYW